MLATSGLLISIGLLMLVLLVPMFRRSDPPRWTTRGWVGEVVTIGLVSTLALGIACLVAGAIETVGDGPGLLDLGLLAVVMVAAIVIGRRLRAWAKSKELTPVETVTATAKTATPIGAGTPRPSDKAA